MWHRGGKMEKIIVLGSINIDLVTVVDRKPKDGETISGKSFFMAHGRKGANQAVSIARLGKKVKFLGTRTLFRSCL